jgi:hypothetical protein
MGEEGGADSRGGSECLLAKSCQDSESLGRV